MRCGQMRGKQAAAMYTRHVTERSHICPLVDFGYSPTHSCNLCVDFRPHLTNHILIDTESSNVPQSKPGAVS